MIKPGLERISRLLRGVKLPWKAVHVAGTNGKGSVCANTSALLTRAHIRNGRFTSPYLVNRWDSICVNDKPVDEDQFRKVEKHCRQVSQRDRIDASDFELLTAAAFHIFTEQDVQISVVEVGMGGRLDATNVLNNQIVSVIAKVAYDHQDFLGSTLPEIASHKAGILRPNVPYVVSSSNESPALEVIRAHAAQIGAGRELRADDGLPGSIFSSEQWQSLATRLTSTQRDNATLAALAFGQVLKTLGKDEAEVSPFLPVLAESKYAGRFQVERLPDAFTDNSRNQFVVDGAHNPDAAHALAEFVTHKVRGKDRGPTRRPRTGWPVTWVLGMTLGKNARSFLETILRPGDNVVTTAFGPVEGMPWVKPMDPRELADVVEEVSPGTRTVVVPPERVLQALITARQFPLLDQSAIVLTGSLYLVGAYLRAKAEEMPGMTTRRLQDMDEAARAEVLALASPSP